MEADGLKPQVQELIIDYSTCYSDAPDYPNVAAVPSNLVTANFKKNSSNTQTDSYTWQKTTVNQTYFTSSTNSSLDVVVPTVQCTINFTIPEDMNPPVLFYYRLTNFYQNHRRYAKSFSTGQLSGTAESASSIDSSDCTPLTTVTFPDGTKKPYYPCGLAPNSVFNDTFFSPVWLNPTDTNANNETYGMDSTTDISWASDKQLYGPYQGNWSDVVVPPNWVERYPNNYSDEYHPDLVNDEHFQVWMRLAGLPTFSKLYQRNNNKTMSSGQYSVNINHRRTPYAPVGI